MMVNHLKFYGFYMHCLLFKNTERSLFLKSICSANFSADFSIFAKFFTHFFLSEFFFFVDLIVQLICCLLLCNTILWLLKIEKKNLYFENAIPFWQLLSTPFYTWLMLLLHFAILHLYIKFTFAKKQEEATLLLLLHIFHFSGRVF